MNGNSDVYVLDTSALFTFIEDEEGVDIIDGLLLQAEEQKVRLYISFISLTELFYITSRERGESTAVERLALVKALAVVIMGSDEQLDIEAAKLKASHRISLADAYIAALCARYSGTLVHKDPEFEQLVSQIQQIRLSYK